MRHDGSVIANDTTMKPDRIHVVITDSKGYRREVEVSAASLDCGCGCVSMRPGRPAYCRPFDNGVLHLEADGEIINLQIQQGTAALTANSLQVLCERATEVSPSCVAKSFPGQPAEATTNKQQTEHYSI
jgi:hypothetical protein